MRFNPISEKRLAYLKQYLEKKLAKAKRLQQLSALTSQLLFLEEADPSPSGEYSRWIINCIIAGDVDLPEDAQKLNELLSTFHRVKQRLPLELRDIHVFSGYSQLRITLLPMLPQLKSVAELQEEGTVLIATAVINEKVYQIFDLQTPEAASKAAQNTGWCVCNYTTARDYLKDGPLFLVVQNDKPFFLCHEPSHQVMDVDDQPISSRNSNHFYAEICFLLKHHLPQFICSEHFQENLSINNLVCSANQCKAAGCETCEFGFCRQCEDWKCKSHIETCESCEEDICRIHADECCGYYFCEKSYGSGSVCGKFCDNCSKRICDSCETLTDCCKKNVCGDCSIGSCSECHLDYCKTCITELVRCDANFCKRQACDDCRAEWFSCSDCDSFYCKEDFSTCEYCGESKCSSCGDVSCEFCDREMCNKCISFCRTCRSSHCDNCIDIKCEVCENHTHDYRRCRTCELDVCEGCRNECRSCEYDFCEECSYYCDGCGHICKKCYQAEWCVVCQEHMCNPEDHLSCAYIRRKRRKS